MPRSPKGRAVARGLDARLHLQHAFMPAGYASLKIAQVNSKMPIDSSHGIYRDRIDPKRRTNLMKSCDQETTVGRERAFLYSRYSLTSSSQG
jgi:hypothetical protein